MKRIILSVASLVLVAVVLGLGWWMMSAPQTPVVEPAVAPAPAPSIHGHIVDSTGQPVAGASVFAGEDLRVETDAQGAFQFEELEPGAYQIRAEAEGFVAGGPPGMQRAEVILSTAPNAPSVRDLRLILQRVGTIRGRVVASGKPVADASVSIYYHSAQGLNKTIAPYVVDAAATSDPSGRFELTKLAPGRLQLLIEAPDFALAESRHLVVEPAETLGPIIVDLAPSATLVGEVLDTQGEPVSAEIVLRAESEQPGQSQRNRRSRADKSGRFAFRNIPAGVYSLEAIAPGYRSTRVEAIDAVIGEVKSYDLVMEPGDGIFGRVLDPQGAPVVGAYVVFNPFEGAAADSHPRARQHRVRSDRDGNFQWADPPERNYVATAVSPHHADSKPQRVRRGHPNTFELGTPGALSGRVVGPDGRAVQSFSVGVSNFESPGPLAYLMRAIGVERVNDSSGRFRLDRLRPGKYWLSVESADFAPATSELVVVRRGAETSGVTIQLGQAGRVTGTVRDETNAIPSPARMSPFLSPARRLAPTPPAPIRTAASASRASRRVAEASEFEKRAS